MGIFNRFSDIVNSNLSAMLDKAEDPEKMLRLIISEMETTLFEVRSSSAKTIAEKKEVQRQLANMENEVHLWEQRAAKAVSCERDDLAKAALNEKHRLEQALVSLTKELADLEASIMRLDQDIAKLQTKRDDAVTRRNAMLTRQQTVQSSVKVRKQLDNHAIDEAIYRFDRFEQRINELEAQVEAMDLGRNVSLSQQIEALDQEQFLDAELAELKARMTKKAS